MRGLAVVVVIAVFYVALGVYVSFHHVRPAFVLPCQPMTTGVSIAKARVAWFECAKSVALGRKPR